MMRIDLGRVVLLREDAKLIVHSESHFVALRRLDGEWEINLGNKTHTWQKAVIAMQPCTGQPFLSETPEGCCVLNPEKASMFRIVCCDSAQSTTPDVLGGSGQEAMQGHAMQYRLRLLDVWRLVWPTCMWEWLPMASFRELSQCNCGFRAGMADLEERWNQLQVRMTAPDVLGIFEGLRLPHMKEVLVPSFSWDLYGSRRLETRQFRMTRKFELQARVKDAWNMRNPLQAAGIEFLAQHARRCGFRDTIRDDDGITVQRVRSVILQLQLGPARAYVTFVESRDFADVSTDSSAHVDSSGEDEYGGATFHGWLERVEEDASYFMPCGVDGQGLSPLTTAGMCAQDAADWFMSEVVSYRGFFDAIRLMPSFPVGIQHCVPISIITHRECAVEQKPLWYMSWWVSVANLACHVCVTEGETIFLLWVYTWPRSSLKEALWRLGAPTAVAYQELQCAADWNARTSDSHFVLVPWPEETQITCGRYIMHVHGIFGALWVKPESVQWSCGRMHAEIPLQNVKQFLRVQQKLELYRVVRCCNLDCVRMRVTEGAAQALHGATDVWGGSDTNCDVSLAGAEVGKNFRTPQVNDRAMTFKMFWLEKILAQQKTLELRSRRAKRGFVWLAAGNVIYGSAEIEGSEALSTQRFLELRQQHCLPDAQLPYKKTPTFGISLANVQRLAVPVAFCRLRGTCGWSRVRYSVNDLAPNTKPKRKAWKDCAWPTMKDIALFQPTACFTPTKKKLSWEGSDVVQPEFGEGIVNSILVSANTLGDGACGVHAVFGTVNPGGQLECAGAREMAADALKAALCSKTACEERYVAAVREAIWSELAVPGAQATGGAEAKLFWENLLTMCPVEAAEVSAACEVSAANYAASIAQKMLFLHSVVRSFWAQRRTLSQRFAPKLATCQKKAQRIVSSEEETEISSKAPKIFLCLLVAQQQNSKPFRTRILDLMP